MIKILIIEKLVLSRKCYIKFKFKFINLTLRNSESYVELIVYGQVGMYKENQ